MFSFKQFSLDDSRSAMKIGTDAILLGAYCEFKSQSNILEIGSGCGIISLMLAQKNDCTIDAIDIDYESYMQAKENFANSKWKNNLKALNHNFIEFAKNAEQRYDFIVSNPPFFSNALLNDDKRKAVARHQQSLNLKDLIFYSAKLIKPKGKIYIIIPYEGKKGIEEFAKEQKLFIIDNIIIYPKEEKAANRIILGFSNFEYKYTENKFVVRKNNGEYSDQYRKLSKDYHPFL